MVFTRVDRRLSARSFPHYRRPRVAGITFAMANRVVGGPRKLGRKQVQLIANGDLRLSANQVCWPAQQAMEQALHRAVAEHGYLLVRAHPYKDEEKHGFIGSQKEGLSV